MFFRRAGPATSGCAQSSPIWHREDSTSFQERRNFRFRSTLSILPVGMMPCWVPPWTDCEPSFRPSRAARLPAMLRRNTVVSALEAANENPVYEAQDRKRLAYRPPSLRRRSARIIALRHSLAYGPFRWAAEPQGDSSDFRHLVAFPSQSCLIPGPHLLFRTQRSGLES